jgi:hypothetical protein
MRCFILCAFIKYYQLDQIKLDGRGIGSCEHGNELPGTVKVCNFSCNCITVRTLFNGVN